MIRILPILLAASGVVIGIEAAAAANRAAERPNMPTKDPPPRAVPTHDPGCLEIYSNTAIPRGFYFPAGAGIEVLDELHLGRVYVTDLCAFDFDYFKAGPGTTDATVTFYQGSAGDNPPAGVLASVFLPGLPSGQNGFHIEMPMSTLEQEIWLGVSFSTSDAGLVVAGPPYPGASHDFFYMRPPDQYFTFGGNPPSNFRLAVYAMGELVDVAEPEPGLSVGFVRLPSPNPTAEGVNFRFAVARTGSARLEIIDIAGRVVSRVLDKVLPPGIYDGSWDGRNSRGGPVAPGVYLVRLTLPGFVSARKIIVRG